MQKKRQNKVKRVVKKATNQAKQVSTTNNNGQETPNFKIPNKKYVEGVGRRKVATARVRIYEGEGDLVVNDMLAKDYFAGIEMALAILNKPFELTGTKDKFALTATVKGSGISAQLDALVHGLSRALVKHNPEFKIFLKGAGLLTRDDRMKETRKIGMGGKARRQRQSPKR